MNIKIKMFPKNQMLVGLGIIISKIVTSKEMKDYDRTKEYPRMYTIEIGLLFAIIEVNIKGGS